ncbi:glycine cleavage system protein GcvH [Halothermothrix orenii]|uniref:Glycine cleavage system H protein n=1 Tax=Halothermothrix orenii (strain H 168 / OCM 544 / DSM 9562) TaxID=373903 RepID=GCSH_HALOH|nr:glycine cleavage system protein GcvH [Halothermothrix orenii]B8D1D6.1 RecName: Full=Glycine cleavage system H protein [Halothermothrix orenii H 168]ACL71088.1 glycine cleavage system H protein [Halothermothrix orenii H 168]
MNVPENLMYTKNHEWIKVDGDTALVGVTDYAQKELGDIVFVELPEVSDEFAQSEGFAVLESVKAVSDVYLPVGGEVLEANEELLENPELVNQEPYASGWLVKIKLADKKELEDLMSSEEYARYLEEVE